MQVMPATSAIDRGELRISWNIERPVYVRTNIQWLGFWSCYCESQTKSIRKFFQWRSSVIKLGHCLFRHKVEGHISYNCFGALQNGADYNFDARHPATLPCGYCLGKVSKIKERPSCYVPTKTCSDQWRLKEEPKAERMFKKAGVV